MTKQTDTIIRLSLLAGGVIATIAMFVTASNGDLGRVERFIRLVLLGTAVAAATMAVELGTTHVDRIPLLPRLGRPPRPAGPVAAAPDPISPPSDPIVLGLALKPTLGALAGSVVAALVTGVLGYALARHANSDGGLLLYVAFAAACLLALRSSVRLLTSSRAVLLGAERITLGAAIGHIPSTSISRQDVSGIELAPESPKKIAIVDADGRRFEIRPAHLRPNDLEGYIAAMWPEVRWHELPKTSRRF